MTSGGPYPVSRRARRGWVIGGGIVVVVALATTLALVLSGHAGSTAPLAIGNAGSRTAVPSTKVFTKVPANGCALVTPATVAGYAPGATCNDPSVMDHDGSIDRYAGWSTTSETGRFEVASFDVTLTVGGNVGSSAASTYASSRQDIVVGQNGVLRDNRDVNGVGDRAFVLYSLNKVTPEEADVEAGVLLGNAEVQVAYTTVTRDPDGGGLGAPLSRQEAENDALAIAINVLAQLH